MPENERNECVVFSSSAELAPLDVFIMLDSSGSMEFPTAGGQSKWEAISAALTAFFEEPASEGIGVALTFFPIIDSSVTELCSTSSVCGVPDACDLLKLCLPSQESCNTSADCPATETCEQIGYCESAPTVSCLPSSQAFCQGTMGACLDLGYCQNRYTCDAEPYESPVVPLTELPGAADALNAAVDAQYLDGGTPTLPAVTGLLGNATTWAEANPDRKIIAVIGTDGQPTVCDPELDAVDSTKGIANIASVASDALGAGVQTFVIGVFASDEAAEAQSNMNQIAAAGGTNEAFIITTTEGVSDKFLEALNAVRLTAKACEFVIPPAPEDDAIDYTELFVKITPGQGEPVYASWVGSPQGCAQSGGFYYDKPLDGVEPPARIILCAATCNLLGVSVDRTVEILKTCEDENPPDG